jgi:nitrogen fixation protein FixH
MEAIQKKQAGFHWGHAVIIYFSMFVVFMLFMVYQASQQTFDLVSENYYDEEIAYQSTIDEQHRANELSVKASLSIADNVLSVRIPSETAAQSGEIYLFSPVATARDKRYALNTDASGLQMLDLGKLDKGIYDVQLRWKSKDVYYRQTERISIK